MDRLRKIKKIHNWKTSQKAVELKNVNMKRKEAKFKKGGIGPHDLFLYHII
jgi:hypothetical protein